MKRLILCIVLFIALIALTAGSYFYIVGTTAKLMNKVEFVAQRISEYDFESALQAASQAEEAWEKFRKRRFLYIDRDNIAEITITISRIKVLTEENLEDELIVECEVALSLLNQYLEKQKINFYNIL